MNDKKLDLDALLDVWSAPKPTAGFADRVLAACMPQPAALAATAFPAAPAAVAARRALPRRSYVAAAALAAAMVLVPFLLSRRAVSSPPSPSVAAIAVDDLGLAHD